MIKRLIQDDDIHGVHFFTLNLEKSVQRILEILQWIGVGEHVHNKLIAVRCITPFGVFDDPYILGSYG